MYRSIIFGIFFSLILCTTAAAQQQTQGNAKSLDQIVAVVNDHIILKSEVDQRVQEYVYQMQQRNNRNIQFDKGMWYSTLEDMVRNYVLLDQAKIDSVTVPDAQVDQMIDQRINQIVQQVGSRSAFEQQMGKSIIQLRAELREQYREDLVIQKFRRSKMQEIEITRPEVEEYFKSIPEDSLPTIPEQVALSQIVAIPPPNDNAREEALELAKQLRDSVVNHGKSIEEMARKYSDGPSASQGGKIDMYPLDQLAPEYSAAASALEPGGISEVVETSFGFHIIRLNNRQGDQIDTNHILISVDQENYNNQAAIDNLTAIRDSLLENEDASFSETARNRSEDPNTAPQGGRILNPQSGNRMLALDQLDPALYRIALLLEEEGDISTPKPFTIGTQNNQQRAYRIVRLDEHVPQHTANLEDDYQQIKSNALDAKRYEALSKWISQLKEDVYIEYKIPMPEQYTTVQN